LEDTRHSSSQETGLEEITDAELYRSFIADALMDLHTAMPCKVISVSGRTVTVEPALNRSVPDGAGNWITEAISNLGDVPIADFVGGGMIITLPVAAGDYGMLIFCQRNIGNWRATGNQGDPGDLGTHTLDGAVFYPGLRPDSKTPANADGTNMVLGSDTNHAARMVIKPNGEIDAGANATNFVAMNDKVMTELGKIHTAIGTILGHTHAVSGGTASASTDIGTGYTAGSNVASTNLKAED
jgi:hypothetical protein